MKHSSLLLECLAERVLIWDGAMGTQIHAAGLTPADYSLPPTLQHFNTTTLSTDGCHELLNITRPDVIQAIHERYFEAGADLVETNTFGNTSIVLAEFGIPGMDHMLAMAAAQVARKAADRQSTPSKPRFVVGAIGPGTKLVSLGQTTFEEIERTYGDSFRGTLEGGADALLIETAQDLLMLKAAIVGAHRAMAETELRVPLFVQVTMEQTGTMLLGSEIGAALNMIECFPAILAFGLNCATGPVEMSEHVRFLGQNSTRPITVQPNAGLPVMERGQGVYKLTPEELAYHHERFQSEFGLAMAGGCCGTTPEHIAAVAQALDGKRHTADAHWIQCRHLFPGFDFGIKDDAQAEAIKLKGCSSLYQFQPYRQDTSFLIVGEKTNANGSRQFREMLSHENWDGLTELARELEGEGSHVLDVCAAYVGRDESKDMRELLSRYNRHIQVPLMIDSTEAPVIEIALQTLAGKPIVNSINFEDGGARTEKVLALCTKYGAAIVALTIDEDGMAKTAANKIAIADRILDRTRAHGLPDHDVFIDCLTFTLGSGDEEFRPAGEETIEAIRELHRRHPAVNSILGVSNISFGLKPASRLILNSAFLHYALEAGLTSAIVHFSKILPENKIEPDIWKIASDLVFDKREFAAV
ncbi:MAG: homocysteine S-methyltransferase family protein [Fimbriimonadaceae bacterium]